MESFWAIILGMYAQAAMMAYVSYRLFPGSGHRLAFDRETLAASSGGSRVS